MMDKLEKVEGPAREDPDPAAADVAFQNQPERNFLEAEAHGAPATSASGKLFKVLIPHIDIPLGRFQKKTLLSVHNPSVRIDLDTEYVGLPGVYSSEKASGVYLSGKDRYVWIPKSFA